MTVARGGDSIDGLKAYPRSNIHVSGPGGLRVLSPELKHLRTVIAPMYPDNVAWGDEGGKTLS